MTRCGCSGACACYVVGGDGATVIGVGTAENPYTVNVTPLTAPDNTIGNDFGLPNYANQKARVHPWSAELSLYNGTGPTLRRLRGIVSRSRRSNDPDYNGYGRITVIGGGIGTGNGNPDYDDAFPTQFRDRLGGTFPVRSDGLLYGHQGGPDSRVTHTGPVTNQGLCAVLSGVSAEWTYSNVKPGQRVDIYYYKDSADFNVEIDGVNHAIATGTGTAIDVASFTVGGTVHTIQVHGVAGGPVYLAAVECVSPSNGITVSNACIGTSDCATSWVSTGVRSLFTTANASPPDLYIVFLGLCDSAQAGNITVFKNTMNSIVNNCRQVCPTIVMAPWNQDDTPTATHANFLAMLYDVADTQAVPLLDLYDRMGSYSVLTDNRMVIGGGDHYNLNMGGHAEIAQALIDLL